MNARRVIVAIAACAACTGPTASSRSATSDHLPRLDTTAPSSPPLTAADGAPKPGPQSTKPNAAPPAAIAAAPAAPTPTPAPVKARPFDEAVAAAVDMLFSKAPVPAGAPPFTVVVDPLVDGMTGEQSVATRTMGDRISALVRTKYTSFAIAPLTRHSLERSTLLLIGTFTPVNQDGKPAGNREAYRICLALIDLRTGRVVAKGWARSEMDGVDPSPLPVFRDNPTWTQEAAVAGYIQSCQGSKVGDPVDPIYLDRLLVSAIVNEAMEAYDAGRYPEALDLYREAGEMTRGVDDVRVLNGLYLTDVKLGQTEAALEQFGHIVDQGLATKRLAVKFLFKPGSTAFVRDQAVSGSYPSWLRRIAERTAAAKQCLEISGHTSPTGPEPLNAHLSQLRAESIQGRLADLSPALEKRTVAVGVGSRENLVGTGRDDVSDALDRRVAFKVIDCSAGLSAFSRAP